MGQQAINIFVDSFGGQSTSSHGQSMPSWFVVMDALRQWMENERETPSNALLAKKLLSLAESNKDLTIQLRTLARHIYTQGIY